MHPKGIDVSVYQGEIDWRKVAASGVEWCMVKCAQGRAEAENFSDNLNRAYANGLRCGVYHFLTARNEAECELELDFLLSLLVRYRPMIRLYVCLDVESGKLPTDRAVLTRMIDNAYRRIEAEGYRCIIYTNLNWLRTRLELGDKRLWLAWWRNPERVPVQADCPSGRLTLWQWGSSQVDGVRSAVDCDFMLVPEAEEREESLSLEQKVEALWKKVFGEGITLA